MDLRYVHCFERVVQAVAGGDAVGIRPSAISFSVSVVTSCFYKVIPRGDGKRDGRSASEFGAHLRPASVGQRDRTKLVARFMFGQNAYLMRPVKVACVDLV